MKIAVVGAGIAGLSAAWLLRQHHAVTLFEAGDYLGGHTHTVDVDLAGQRFDSGMPVGALNAEDFQLNDELWISQTIEPVIMGPSGLLKYGVVMLSKAHQ